jgi:hypothetical protein
MVTGHIRVLNASQILKHYPCPRNVYVFETHEVDRVKKTSYFRTSFMYATSSNLNERISKWEI